MLSRSCSRSTSWRRCTPGDTQETPSYFYNLDTGQSVWKLPSDCPLQEDEVPEFTSVDADQIFSDSDTDESDRRSESSSGPNRGNQPTNVEDSHTPLQEGDETEHDIGAVLESFVPLPSISSTCNTDTQNIDPPPLPPIHSFSATSPASGNEANNRTSLGSSPTRHTRSYTFAEGAAASRLPEAVKTELDCEVVKEKITELGKWFCVTPKSKDRSSIGDPDTCEQADMWRKQTTSSRGSIGGEPFYFNERTGETSWEQPEEKKEAKGFIEDSNVEISDWLLEQDVKRALSSLGLFSAAIWSEILQVKTRKNVLHLYKKISQVGILIEMLSTPDIGTDDEWVQVARDNDYHLMRVLYTVLQPEAAPKLLIVAVQSICLLCSLDFALFENLCGYYSDSVNNFLGCVTYGITCLLQNRNNIGGVNSFPPPASSRVNSVSHEQVMSLPPQQETTLLAWAKMTEIIFVYMKQHSLTLKCISDGSTLLSSGTIQRNFWLQFYGVWLEIFTILPHRTALIGSLAPPTALVLDWFGKLSSTSKTVNHIFRECTADERWEEAARAFLFSVNEGLKEDRSVTDPLEQRGCLLESIDVLRHLLTFPSGVNFLFTSDLNVLIDILLRELDNLPEHSKVRIALLLLLKEVVSSPEWFKRSRYRVRDINTCLRRFLDVAEAALDFPEEVRQAAETIYRECYEILQE